RTASCSRTTICPAISKLRSMHSSRTTTTSAITKASTTSPRPTSTSGAVKPSCWKEKGSNARPSKTVGCFTANKPRNINHDAPDSLLVHSASCLKISDDGHDGVQFPEAWGREAGYKGIHRGAHRQSGLRRELLQIASRERC